MVQLEEHAQRQRVFGRETELARLRHYLDTALTGKHQIVFITGEPGVGAKLVFALLGV